MQLVVVFGLAIAMVLGARSAKAGDADELARIKKDYADVLGLYGRPHVRPGRGQVGWRDAEAATCRVLYSRPLMVSAAILAPAPNHPQRA